MNQTKRQTHTRGQTRENKGNVHCTSDTRTDNRFTHKKTEKGVKISKLTEDRL